MCSQQTKSPKKFPFSLSKSPMELNAVLDQLFPPASLGFSSGQRGSSQLSVEHSITIAGVPIGECLGSMVQLIRQQNRVIEELQSQVLQQSVDHMQRIERLERYVTLLTRDLRLDVRPVAAYGQAALPTIADAVTTMEYRLTTMENKRRQQLMKHCVTIATRGRLYAAYQQWSLVARAKGMMRDLTVGQSKRLRQRYLAKWLRFIQISKADQVNKRRVRALNYLSTKNIVQRYYDKWRRFLSSVHDYKVKLQIANHAKSENMSAVTTRGLARRYFKNWVRFVGECHAMAVRVKATLAMEQLSSRVLAQRYLHKFAAYVRLMQVLRYRHNTVHGLSAKAFQRLALTYLDKWKECSSRRIKRRQSRSMVPRLHHLNLVLLARRYFGKLELFAKWNVERREKQAMQLAIQQLARRCDTLGSQLDLGLQTLSHTNGVLSKVLEHVSFNSSWEHRKRASGGSPSPHGTVPEPFAAVAPSSLPPTASTNVATGASNPYASAWGIDTDEWTRNPPSSADELLTQLRSKLQKIHETPR